MFPRLAIHTGNTVVRNNRHPEWEGTITLQHNETTATMLKFGPNMTNAAKLRHPILSTWQSDCRGRQWDNFNGRLEGFGTEFENNIDCILFGQDIENGQVVVPDAAPTTVGVAPAVAH